MLLTYRREIDDMTVPEIAEGTNKVIHIKAKMFDLVMQIETLNVQLQRLKVELMVEQAKVPGNGDDNAVQRG